MRCERCDKVAFPTEAEAWARLVELTGRRLGGQRTTTKLPVRVYECPAGEGFGWHLTSQHQRWWRVKAGRSLHAATSIWRRDTLCRRTFEPNHVMGEGFDPGLLDCTACQTVLGNWTKEES